MKPRATFLCLLALGSAACSNEAPQDTQRAVEQSTAEEPAPLADNSALDVSLPVVAESQTEYSLSVEPEVLPDGRVRLEIKSNIPGTIEVMAGVSLQGQSESDVWIGMNERVRLINGLGVATLDARALPQGEYDAEASFHPRWGFQDSTSRETGISENLSASSDLTVAGSGESANEAQFRKNGQKWIMEHVAMGDSWEPTEFTKRFGAYQELPVHRGNPEILKAYYFPRIDTTLVVNTLKREVAVWRLGRAHS